MTWPDIGDYAVIGDCRTAALISRDGSLDWLCLPHFSSPSVFAALLDRRRGGRFAVQPAGPCQARRRYVGTTNVLETTYRTDGGVLKLTDLMPVGDESVGPSRLRPQREVMRIIEAIEGEAEVEVLFEPRPDYGRVVPRLEQRGRLGWACQDRTGFLLLQADLPLVLDTDASGVRGRVRLRAGERRTLSLIYERSEIAVLPLSGAYAAERVQATIGWWEAWLGQCTYEGCYRDAVHRSALTLKLMTYALSGAVVAAPTTSLPERVGGSLNWDYRYCWLRDASMTLRAFLDFGWPAEADSFLRWLLHATRLTWPKLQVCYDVYGESELKEVVLDHLRGYRDSRPVRIGNAAGRQLQLDIYGAVVLAAHDFVERGGAIDRAEARLLRGLGETVCMRWQDPDNGIWEVRGGRRQHTYSKLMCWVALDRLLALADAGHLEIDRARFERQRAAIRACIQDKGFDHALGAYTGVFGTRHLDACLLLMPRYGFIDANDPRMVATWRRIRDDLDHDGIVFRYSGDFDPDVTGEGAFGICSFWAVDYLARRGRIDEAERRFERLLERANDVGLFAEEIDLASGRALGNFPQAYTHVGLLGAALSIENRRATQRSPARSQAALWH